MHFKEMFLLDGKPSNFTEEDLARRNKIAALLEDWGLVTVVDKNVIKEPQAPMNQIKVIAFKEKADWDVVTKYTIGKPRNA